MKVCRWEEWVPGRKLTADTTRFSAPVNQENLLWQEEHLVAAQLSNGFRGQTFWPDEFVY
jgi:hypothetical protein